jgi:hypothetical protein
MVDKWGVGGYISIVVGGVVGVDTLHAEVAMIRRLWYRAKCRLGFGPKVSRSLGRLTDEQVVALRKLGIRVVD